MKVVMLNREQLYSVIRLEVKYLNVKPIIVELGVLRGENALKMLTAFEPSSMYLIDSWSKESHDEFSASAQRRPWQLSADALEAYYGGALSEKATGRVQVVQGAHDVGLKFEEISLPEGCSNRYSNSRYKSGGHVSGWVG